MLIPARASPIDENKADPVGRLACQSDSGGNIENIIIRNGPEEDQQQ